MNAPVLVQQFAHLIPLDHSYRLSYLLRQPADKTGKITIESRQNTRGKTSKTVHMANISLLKKVMSSLLTDHGQTACFHRLTTRSSLAAAASSLVSLTPRKQRLVVKLARCCRPFRCLVEEAEYTTPRCLCNLNPKKHPYWFQGGKVLLPPLMVQTAIIRVHVTPYRSRRVAAMDHTVTMGCSSRLDVPLLHHRTALRFWVLDIVQEDDNVS